MTNANPVRAALAALALAALLAGCQSAPPAAPAEGAPSGGGAAAPGRAAPGAETTPVPGAGVAGTAQPALDPLKDPNSPLSKRSIYYGFDKYDVTDEYKPIVDAHAKYLRDHPGVKMLIQGNTDERGSREYNVALGQRRAEGVRRLLILLGVPEDQVEAVSLGEEKPRAKGRSEEAYAENRRCDMLYPGEY